MNTDLKAIEKFYCFWKWEYQRRNAQYRKDYYALVEFAKERLNTTDIDEENIVKSVNTYFRFHRNPDERPKVIMRQGPYISSPSIDKKISEAFEYFYQIYKIDPIGPLNGPTINKIFTYISDNKQPHDIHGSYFSPSRQYIFQTIGIKQVISYHMDKRGTSYSLFDTDFSPTSQYQFQTLQPIGVERTITYGINRMYFDIDFNKPLKSIIIAITYYHAMAQPSPPYESSERKVYEQKLEAIWSKIIKHYICKDKPQKFKFNNSPRAVGLWLWDYTQQNNCKSTTAVNAFREEFTNDEDEVQPIEKLGYTAATEDRVFTRLLSNTKTCIDEMEVLSLSK